MCFLFILLARGVFNISELSLHSIFTFLSRRFFLTSHVGPFTITIQLSTLALTFSGNAIVITMPFALPSLSDFLFLSCIFSSSKLIACLLCFFPLHLYARLCPRVL